jgi:mono/diheme cytochrome c family protein
MRILTRFLVAVFAVLAVLVPAVKAGDCAGAVYHSPHVQKQVVVAQPVVLTQFVPVVVPAYSVGYDPSTPGVVEELRAIREELARAREALTAPQAGGPLVLPQQAPPDPMRPLKQTSWQGVLQKHCAACHTGEKAKAGLQIFTAPGILGDANPFDLWDVVAAGAMPPKTKPRLDAAEATALKAWVREATAARGK